jgi:hypothetical protein
LTLIVIAIDPAVGSLGRRHQIAALVGLDVGDEARGRGYAS